MDTARVLKVGEVVSMLGWTHAQVYHAIRRGKIRGRKIKKEYAVEAASVMPYLAERTKLQAARRNARAAEHVRCCPHCRGVLS